ncbi:MAG TPA: NADH-quinone oxidoreductase subunit B family protein [Planctomycetota bacterium]|nr:NADH-quinone oxidoreductase subunit B family protein [Planctomycetota bacterium]
MEDLGTGVIGSEKSGEGGWITTKLSELVNWGRRNSLWPMPFGTACCAIEMMATLSSRYDLARFGAEVIRFSPRQSDLMIVSGRVCIKMMPVLIEIYNQMPEPKWCISMGACASTGGVFDTYTMIQGVDQFIPVDVYIPGCPPRPESLIDAVMLIQQKIKRRERNMKLYDRTKHPLDFEPVALVSNAAEAPPQLTGSRHSLPEKDRCLQEDLFGPPEREVKHVGYIGTQEVGVKQV